MTQPAALKPPSTRVQLFQRDLRHVLIYMGRYGAIGLIAMSTATLLYLPVFICLVTLKLIVETLTFGAITIGPVEPRPSQPVPSP